MSPQEQNGNRFGASTAASSHSKTKAPAVYPEHRCTPGVRARQQPLISLNESARYAAISRGTYEHRGEKAEDYRGAYRALSAAHLLPPIVDGPKQSRHPHARGVVSA